MLEKIYKEKIAYMLVGLTIITMFFNPVVSGVVLTATLVYNTIGVVASVVS